MNSEGEYIAFPNIHWRNYLQKFFEIPIVINALELPLNLRMLEVGCGRGIALPSLKRLCKPAIIIGLDIDGELIRIAKERMAKRRMQINLVHADMRQMPFADESFDLIIDFGTLYHIADAEAAVHEISRVLRTGGSFISETWMNQLFAHPMDSPNRHKVRWDEEPTLTEEKRFLLWCKRRKRRF